VPVIADIAYPRLPTQPGPAELEAFTPEAAESAFARQKTRQPGPRLALLVLLKTFQHLGRVVRLADVPTAILAHVAASAGLADAIPELAGYDDTTYRVHLATLVRSYAGVVARQRRWPVRDNSKWPVATHGPIHLARPFFPLSPSNVYQNLGKIGTQVDGSRMSPDVSRTGHLRCRATAGSRPP